ncbi:MAG: hypothetical protein IJS66_03515 [Bacteroidales bacterium]|nr:hypothetical protein [Bacteroidales bacterium]
MGMFSFFGEGEHRVFNYRPVYFDPEEEERKRRFGAVDGSAGKKKDDGTYVPGSYIKGSFRDGNYSRNRSHLDKTRTIIGIITLLLLFAVLYFVAKFYSML